MDERRLGIMKDFRCRGKEDGMMIFVELQFEVMDLKATGHRKDESFETVGIVSHKHELSEVPFSFLGRMPKPSIQCASFNLKRIHQSSGGSFDPLRVIQFSGNL